MDIWTLGVFRSGKIPSQGVLSVEDNARISEQHNSKRWAFGARRFLFLIAFL